ncbi:MAG: hypothetical protein AAB217_10775 [Chloroflexota bacterium]
MHPVWRYPIWELVTILVGVIAILATYDVFTRSEQFKDLRIVTLASTSLVEIRDSGTSSEIKVLYAGKQIDNLSLFQIKIENTGTEPILEQDYSQPIRFTFPRESKIIDAAILDSSPSNIGATVQTSQNTASLSPVLLNPHDRFIVRFVVADIPPPCPQLLDFATRLPSEFPLTSIPMAPTPTLLAPTATPLAPTEAPPPPPTEEPKVSDSENGDDDNALESPLTPTPTLLAPTATPLAPTEAPPPPPTEEPKVSDSDDDDVNATEFSLEIPCLQVFA